jgi:hypothetical protein
MEKLLLVSSRTIEIYISMSIFHSKRTFLDIIIPTAFIVILETVFLFPALS